jgi:hypothetical protein
MLDAMQRNGVRVMQAETLLDAVKQRVALYDDAARTRKRPIRLYVNVGGGLASLGGTQNARLIPAGLNQRLTARNYPNRGVINILAERGIPILHLLEVEKLAREFGITDEGGEPVQAGTGFVFILYRYNLWIVGASAVLLLGANFFVLRLDIRQQILGRPHPERNSDHDAR